MDQVRVGIVGLGIGKANARALAANPRGRVTALCDIIEEKMPAFAPELPEQPKFFVDYEEMCQSPDIDAVFVGTPNQLHVPVALAAVRAGKHVLCTKPLSDSAEAAAQLVKEAEAAGVVNMMSLSLRFSEQVQYLGKRVQQGEFGDIYYTHASSIRRSGIPDWNPGFVEKGGGAFRDMGVHFLDSTWWLMGMPKPVSAVGVAGAKFGPRGQGFWDYRVPPQEYYGAYAADDYAGGFIRFENGAGMQVESFWASHMPESGTIDIFGTEAGGSYTRNDLTIYKTVNGAPQDATIALPTPEHHFGRVADHFIDCVLDGIPCEAPLRHGWMVQQMMEAVLKSGETGEEIRFDE